MSPSIPLIVICCPTHPPKKNCAYLRIPDSILSLRYISPCYCSLLSTGWLCLGYSKQTFAYRAGGGRLRCIMQGSSGNRVMLIRADRDLNQNQIWDVTDLERIGGLIGPIACRPTHNSICPPWNIYPSPCRNSESLITPSLVISDRLSFVTQEVDLAAGNRKSG